MRRIACLVLLGLSVSFVPLPKPDPRIAAVENGLSTYLPVAGVPGQNLLDRMRVYGVPGLSIAVIHEGKLAWAKGYGWADTLRKVPVTTETLFSAGSVSKPVAALGALRLVESGKLGLDAPIDEYLKSWKTPQNEFTRQQPVTLRHLLSHTAGTTQHGFWGIQPGDTLPTVPQILNGERVAQSRRVDVDFVPGTQWRYSGGGTTVAQLAVMDVTSEPYAEVLRKTVLDPLGMRRSTFAQPLPESWKENAAWPYCRQNWFKGQPHVYPQQAAAGLYSTPSDLARFVVEIQRAYAGKSKVLRTETVRTMLTPVPTKMSWGRGYGFATMALDQTDMGLGFFLGNRSDGGSDTYFFHTGQNAGFVTYCIGSLREGNGAVVMINENDADGLLHEVIRSIAKAYGWRGFLHEPLQPLALTATQLDAFAGTYRRGEERITLTRQGTHLVQNGEGWRRGIDAYLTGPDTIRFTDYVTEGVFTRDAQGRIKSCEGMLNGKKIWEMVRVE
jgi:CubicO group peptidase (beta-lactamase class C family)